MKILIITPCYNEENNVRIVKDEVQQYVASQKHQIDHLFINDCSKDNTLKVLKEISANYLDLPTNLGIGGGMHLGYKYAYLNNYDIAIQLDGDAQHIASEIDKLLVPIFSDNANVVIGSRFLEEKSFQSSFMRRVGIRFFTVLNKFLVEKTIYDSTSGFRAFDKTTIELVYNYYPDEYPEPEAIIIFAMCKLKIVEVSVKMRERLTGVSSISSIKSAYYMIKVSLSIIFVYLRFRKLNGRSIVI